MSTAEPVYQTAEGDKIMVAARTHVSTTTAPVVPKKTMTTAHPFFKKTSEKKQDLKQQKELEAAKAKAEAKEEEEKAKEEEEEAKTEVKPEEFRSKTPTSLLQDDQLKPAKPKRGRKPRSNSRATAAPRPTKTAKSKLHQKQQVFDEPSPPLQPPPPTSSPNSMLQSIRTEIDPVTAVAPPPLTPSSSPPPPISLPETLPEPHHAAPQEAEAVVDPNEGRRKRRKTTPPQRRYTTSIRVVVDPETNLIVSSPVASLRREMTDPGAIEWQSPKLTIRARGNIKPEDLLPKVKLDVPSSPVLPLATHPHPPIPSSLVQSTVSTPKKTRVAYNKEKGILTIKSSPPGAIKNSPPPPPLLPEPTRKNLFSVLGKKKEAPKKELPKQDVVVTEDKPAKKEKKEKTSRRKRTKKEEDVQHDESDVAANIEEPRKTLISVVIPVKKVPIKQEPAPQPPKIVHPFFNPAQRKKMAQAAPTEPEVQTPPEEPKTNTANNTSPKPSRPTIGSGFGSTFGRMGDTTFTTFSNRISKIPGMLEPLWPVKGTCHIRGLTPPADVKTNEDSQPNHQLSTQRKLKNAVSISNVESLFAILGKKLQLAKQIEDLKSMDYAERKYRNVPPEVRMPKRIVTTGSQLQEMIRTRVHTRLPHPNAIAQEPDESESDSDSVSDMALSQPVVHPVLQQLYQRLRTEVSPFDEQRCETTPWEIKYAPSKAGEVLQPGREVSIFAAWLTGLKTDKLDVPVGKSGKRKAKREGSGLKGGIKKKRKKRAVEDDGLGGFVVNSEEEEDLMDEISDPEEDDWTSQNQKTKKSTIRAGDKYNNLDELFGSKAKESKKTNAILISGPNGCGKTAAVYAVAKELGYVVFEVSPGTRRNGKDLLDQVGDMSRNHLVHQQKGAIAQQDNPFAIAKAAKQKEPTPAPTADEDSQTRQQQSLILLEEVDILFEEDKTFWASVLTLMSKSKRPIVMTCNDESLVPIDTLSLHAILRFSMPKHDLVVDKLLLVCANEGHLLQRPAVDTLVKANNGDIRSSLMDLQFHCRIGVGDRTGSLAWQLRRWPIGCDIADNGEKLRVVSVDTYQPGIGLVDNCQDMEEQDKWEDIWKEYDIDMGSSILGLSECTRDIQAANVSNKVSLPIMNAFFEARSAADAFAGYAMLGSDEARLDFTLPIRTECSKLDDIQGISIVQTDRYDIPGSVETEMAIYTRSLARSYLASKTKKLSVTLQPINQTDILAATVQRNETASLPFCRMEYQSLFAPLSKFEAMFASTQPTTHSSIYPSLTKLSTEIAPIVRHIVRNDIKLEKMRRDTSKLLSAGGKKRTTRAARLAHEGGSRMKKERWLRGLGANILRSAGEGWDEGVLDADGEDDDEEDISSPETSATSQDS